METTAEHIYELHVICLTSINTTVKLIEDNSYSFRYTRYLLHFLREGAQAGNSIWEHLVGWHALLQDLCEDHLEADLDARFIKELLEFERKLLTASHPSLLFFSRASLLLLLGLDQSFSSARRRLLPWYLQLIFEQLLLSLALRLEQFNWLRGNFLLREERVPLFLELLVVELVVIFIVFSELHAILPDLCGL